METHSNILAWEIPWTEEPGGPLLATLRCHQGPAPVGQTVGTQAVGTLHQGAA